jgi:hypothetical protein
MKLLSPNPALSRFTISKTSSSAGNQQIPISAKNDPIASNELPIWIPNSAKFVTEKMTSAPF